MSSLSICPYSLKPISELSEKSREHIIPDAIGGPDGFSVFAEKSENSRLNNSIDAPFVNEDLLKILAAQHGVVTRSGPATWNLRGKTVIDGRELDISSKFGGGSVNTRMRKPVITDPETGKVCSVVGWEDQIYTNLETIKKNLEKKHGEGKVQIQIADHRITHNPVIQGEFSVDLLLLRIALCKIAYLSLSYTFGDDFVCSHVGESFRQALESQTEEEYDLSGIKDDFFNTEKILVRNLMRLPATTEGHHQVFAAKFTDFYVATVSLFGNSTLSATFSILTTPSPFAGTIYSCSPAGGGIVQKDYFDHLREIYIEQNRHLLMGEIYPKP